MQPGVPESTMLLLRVKVIARDADAGKVSVDYWRLRIGSYLQRGHSKKSEAGVRRGGLGQEW
jgi:hypothetical protein